MKKILRFLLSVMLMSALVISAAAVSPDPDYRGGDDWNVTFTQNKKMLSNFKSANMDDSVSGLQPGDNIVFTIDLKNAYGAETDWYMENKVLYSLEDRSANSGATGGAYTYVLVYTDTTGKETVLFSSDTLGGTGSKSGLRGGTNALEDYFYLDTLSSGQKGTIQLEVALEGETLGNNYQDTLADLHLRFAVELPTGKPNQPGEPDNGKRTGIVKTGDDTNLIPWLIAAGVSGLLLLLLALYGLKKARDAEKEAD